MSNIVRLGIPGRQDKNLAELVEDFLADLRVDGKTAATVRTYGTVLRAFADAWRGSVDGVTPQGLREYLRTAEGLSAASRAKQRVVLGGFFRWCIQLGHLEANPAEHLPRVRLPDAQPRAMHEADIDRVLDRVANKRDRLLFQLIADTGLRASEALGVRLEQIRLGAQELTVMGKGKRERTVYLVKTEALGLLRRFLRAEGWLARDGETITERGYLFRPDEAKQRAGKAGGPLSYSVAEKAWRKACREAGVEASLHQLRHSHATGLINKGVPVEVVQRILGHRNLASTQRYAVVSEATIKRALEGL